MPFASDGERMKAKRRHRVPLTDRMVEILGELRDLQEAQGEFVFPSPDRDGPLSAAMLALLERIGAGHVTVHGFRSSFRDWASEMTAFDEDVIEFSLSHVEGSKAKATYKRSDLLEKRRLLMTAWAAYVRDIVPDGLMRAFNSSAPSPMRSVSTNSRKYPALGSKLTTPEVEALRALFGILR